MEKEEGEPVKVIGLFSGSGDSQGLEGQQAPALSLHGATLRPPAEHECVMVPAIMCAVCGNYDHYALFIERWPTRESREDGVFCAACGFRVSAARWVKHVGSKGHRTKEEGKREDARCACSVKLTIPAAYACRRRTCSTGSLLAKAG